MRKLLHKLNGWEWSDSQSVKREIKGSSRKAARTIRKKMARKVRPALNNSNHE